MIKKHHARMRMKAGRRVDIRESIARPGTTGGTWSLPGICAHSRIETSFGMVPANLIRKGDPVRERHGRFVPVRSLRGYSFDAEFIARRPDALPVQLAGAASEASEGQQIILVSPAQEVLVSGGEFGKTETLVPASGLGEHVASDTLRDDSLTYFAPVFDEDVLVCVDGIWMSFPAKSS